MDQYPLTKAHPMPVANAASHYPFAKMDVGHSFDAPLAQAGALSSAASAYGKKHDKRFCVRSIKAAGVVRCWRLE